MEIVQNNTNAANNHSKVKLVPEKAGLILELNLFSSESKKKKGGEKARQPSDVLADYFYLLIKSESKGIQAEITKVRRHNAAGAEVWLEPISSDVQRC